MLSVKWNEAVLECSTVLCILKRVLVSANEALIPVSQLFLRGIVEKLLRPRAFEELSQARISKTV